MPKTPLKTDPLKNLSALPPGAERLDVFMARANAHYYATHPILSDFVTSPEISQIFGELLGAWAVAVWYNMGRPSPVILAEAGPGRGTLMADALRLITRVAPDMARAADVHLIETSPLMRAAQADALRPYTSPTWHDSLTELPEQPFILLANEFLDALPVRQFVHTPAQGWHEHYVAGENFISVSCPPPQLPDKRTFEDSTVVELCEPALDIARLLGLRMTRHAGAALFIDYGHFSQLTGDSLQALRHARPAHPLKAAGEADLTTHVDFLAFATAAQQSGAQTWGAVTQGTFLRTLGLMERTEQLAAHASPADAQNLHHATARLAAPEKMGHLFKVLALTSVGMSPPPGFTKGPAA
ncbi:class I SAM-dependent methyltransferase [Acetobacter sp. DsW_059]|uniref:class I SAM-dependent methyltransferase n=1 Tax=Acetobacter sp. DsW_059 TaxID=1670661 RepID=UPI000A3B53F1|nr:SAM-dependent methyltransferase [Acetobacter sp. DsW_059]